MIDDDWLQTSKILGAERDAALAKLDKVAELRDAYWKFAAQPSDSPHLKLALALIANRLDEILDPDQ